MSRQKERIKELETRVAHLEATVARLGAELAALMKRPQIVQLEPQRPTFPFDPWKKREGPTVLAWNEGMDTVNWGEGLWTYLLR